MAQLKATSDIVTRVLKKGGEVTNGNSSYTESIVEYLTDVHRAIIAGGTIFDPAIIVDNNWPWARAEHPIILNLQPKFSTGTFAISNGGLAGTFSSAPSASVAGWYIRGDEEKEVYKIIHHTAGATAFTIDSPYLESTTLGKAFEVFKLDYEVLSPYIYITAKNNKIDFVESGTTQITATLTVGVYTPAALATEIATQLNAAGGTPTYTVSYDSDSRKFTITSNLAGGAVFYLLGATGTNSAKSALPTLGFHFLNTTSAASQISAFPVGSVSRLIEPLKYFSRTGYGGKINYLDPLTFQEDCDPRMASEGQPTRFTKILEDSDGKITIRLDNYPAEISRIEINYMPVPVDLQNNASSRPLLPLKYYPILEYAGTFFLLSEKEDTKADFYLNLAKAQLKSMQENYRTEHRAAGKNFGEVIPRADRHYPARGLAGRRYGYDAGEQ